MERHGCDGDRQGRRASGTAAHRARVDERAGQGLRNAALGGRHRVARRLVRTRLRAARTPRHVPHAVVGAEPGGGRAAPEAAAKAIKEDLQGQIERAHDEKERTRLTLQLREVDEITAKGPLTLRLPLPNDRAGYGTMLGFSAGGGTFVTALPSPDDQYELLVATGASLEGEKRTPNEKSAAYEQAMRERPLQVSDAIAQVVYQELFGGAQPKSEGPKTKDEGSKTKDDAAKKSEKNSP